MGWSHTGADRMSKLRCHIENFGEEKIIDLVRYSRQQRSLKRTGTDDVEMDKVTTREILAEHYDQGRSYIERLQATIPGITARKSAAIRTQLRLL
nr:ISLre2 family transposase [Lachnospiraceae bacterium]